MRSPPFSSEMSLSACRRESMGTPIDEVEALMGKALQVTSLDHTLSTIFAKHKYLFLDVLSRQIGLISSRSQAFEDAHITVYDKVLLNLTRNGNDLEDAAAITWYASEYLGFNSEGGTARNTQLVEQGLTLAVAVNQALEPLHNNIGPNIPASTPAKPQEFQPSRHDPAFVRLWTVFEQAREEYLQVADNRDFRAGDAARFLRDTAENGIHYLARHPNQDADLSRELTDTYNMATRAVEKLCGGKKRKFDHAAEKHRYGRSTRRPALISSQSLHKPVRVQERRILNKPRNPGRGHSGLPYGYANTRDVDSYVPHRD